MRDMLSSNYISERSAMYGIKVFVQQMDSIAEVRETESRISARTQRSTMSKRNETKGSATLRKFVARVVIFPSPI